MTVDAPSLHDPLIRPIGLTGVLFTFSDVLTDDANHMALAFRAQIETAAIVGVIETSTSLTSTYVAYDPCAVGLNPLIVRLKDLLSQTKPSRLGSPMGRRLWRIPTVFGGDAGPQLAEAAAMAGLSPKQAIDEIAATTVRVLTIGFAPGQPYLGPLPQNWNVPRQSGLTAQVPAGAIAVAIRQMVLFNAASPTGWRLIGQTAFRVFRPEATDPFSLRPGDEVQLVPVSQREMSALRARQDGSNGGASCEGGS
ncbi:MAG: hypothetical protein RIR95_1411 [Pseudomonadota bacterium]